MIVIVHTGVGFYSSNEKKFKSVCKNACLITKKNLSLRKLNALEAVAEAITILEDSDCTNAGYGSNLTDQGQVECDASIMSEDGHFGAVGFLSDCKHPINAALNVLLDQKNFKSSLGLIPPLMLVGESAKRKANQLDICPSNQLISRSSYKCFEKIKRYMENEKMSPSIMEPQKCNYYPELDQKFDFDTVGAICMDSFGHIATGCSSGGSLFKPSGRIGSAAIYGVGAFVLSDNIKKDINGSFPIRISCTVSGQGEYLIRKTMAKSICETIFSGLSCKTQQSQNSVDSEEEFESIESFLTNFMIEQSGIFGAIILIDSILTGVECWIIFNSDAFCFAYTSNKDRMPIVELKRLKKEINQPFSISGYSFESPYD